MSLDLKVDKSTKINGKPLSSNVDLTKYDIGLSNVDNLSLTSSISQMNTSIGAINSSIGLLTQSLQQKVDKSTMINSQTIGNQTNVLVGATSLDQQLLNSKESLSNKNIPNGYAGLDSSGKILISKIPISGLTYIGMWDASTNTPVLSSSSIPVSGNYYVVQIGGNTQLSSVNEWGVNDWVISNGIEWLRIKNSDSIQSVNGYTGPVINLSNGDIGLGNVDNTSDANKPVSTAQQIALNLKVDKTITVNGYALMNDISLVKGDVGMSNVDNTADIDKPVSTAQQAELDLKQSLSEKNVANGYAGLDSGGKLFASQMPITGLAYLGTWDASTNSPTITSGNGLAGNYYKVSVNGTTTIDGISSWHTNDLIIYNGSSWEKIIGNDDAVTSVNSHTGVVVLNKTDIGLSNVDNTSDANKPVSTAQQTALNLKVDKTTTVNGYALSSNVSLVKGDVGLGNVDNTSDANKPVSTAQQTALNLKVDKTTTVNGQPLSSNVTLNSKNILHNYQSLNSSGSISYWESLVTVDASSGNITVTLPLVSSSTLGQSIGIIKVDSTSNSVNVNSNGANLLNGSTSSFTLSSQYDGCYIQNDGVSNSWVASCKLASSGGGGGSSSNVSTLGINTNSPQASIDIEGWAKSNLSLLNGVVDCPCDEFGYPQYIEILSSSSVLVKSPLTINVNGVGTTFSSSTVLSGLTSPVYYIYADTSSTPTITVTQVPPEVYTSRTFINTGYYMNMNNLVLDPCGNIFTSSSQKALSFSNSIVKYGSRSIQLTNDALLSAPLGYQTGEITSDRCLLFHCATWMFDCWIYPVTLGINQGLIYFANGIRNSSAGLTIYTSSSVPTNLVIYYGNSTSAWTINGVSLGTINLNQWNYLGVSFDNATLKVALNGTVVTTTGQVCISYTSSIYWSIGWLSGFQAYYNDICFTPFLRSFQPSAAFDATQLSTYGSSYASLLTGNSLTDAYGYKWYASPSLVTGASHLGVPSISISAANTSNVYTHMSPNYSQSPQWTIECWFNVTAVTNPSYLFDAMNGSPACRLAAAFTSTSSIAMYLSSTGSTWNIFNGSSVTIPSSGWIHFAITYNSLTGYVVYVNGTSMLTSTITSPSFFSGLFHIGRQPMNTGSYQGTFLLSEFRMSPFLVYSGNFSVPTSALTTNCTRDLYDTTLGTYVSQPSNSNVSRVYLGCVRMDTKRVRHYASKQNIQPSLMSNTLPVVYRDTTLRSAKTSFSFPSWRNSQYQAAMVFLRGDGRIIWGGSSVNNVVSGLALNTSGSLDSWRVVPCPLEVKFQQIFQGTYGYGGVDQHQNVWMCGVSYSHFGTGNSNNLSRLTMVYSGTNIQQAFTTGTYTPSSTTASSFILDNGSIWASGQNGYGQLGQNSATATYASWVQIPKISGNNWGGVYSNGVSTYAWTDSSSGNLLYACGVNSSGTLGVGTTVNVLAMTPCLDCSGTQLSNVKKVLSMQVDATAYNTTYVLLNNGDLYMAGQAGSLSTGTGSSLIMSSYTYMFVGPILQNVTNFELSNYGILALLTSGMAKICGLTQNGFGLGTASGVNASWQEVYIGGDRVYNIKAIFGNATSYIGNFGIVTTDGKVYLAGGNNTNSNCLGAIPIASTVFGVSEVIMSEPIEDVFFCQWSTIAGGGVTYLKGASGRIFGCGSNSGILSNYGADQYDFTDLKLAYV